MQEAAKNLLLVLVALFPIVDPLGGSPFFLALTREYSTEARKALSWRIAMNSFFLLVGSYFVGTYVLAFFGISVPVVQVGGGLIVIATGWSLLKQRDDEKHPADQRPEHDLPIGQWRGQQDVIGLVVLLLRDRAGRKDR